MKQKIQANAISIRKTNNETTDLDEEIVRLNTAICEIDTVLMLRQLWRDCEGEPKQ